MVRGQIRSAGDLKSSLTFGTLIAFSAVLPLLRRDTGKSQVEGQVSTELHDLLLFQCGKGGQDLQLCNPRKPEHLLHTLEKLRRRVTKRIPFERPQCQLGNPVEMTP